MVGHPNSLIRHLTVELQARALEPFVVQLWWACETKLHGLFCCSSSLPARLAATLALDSNRKVHTIQTPAVCAVVDHIAAIGTVLAVNQSDNMKNSSTKPTKPTKPYCGLSHSPSRHSDQAQCSVEVINLLLWPRCQTCHSKMPFLAFILLLLSGWVWAAVAVTDSSSQCTLAPQQHIIAQARHQRVPCLTPCLLDQLGQPQAEAER